MTEEPALDDPDNPEWTGRDFAEASGPETLSAGELSSFRRTRRDQELPEATKQVAESSLSASR